MTLFKFKILMPEEKDEGFCVGGRSLSCKVCRGRLETSFIIVDLETGLLVLKL